MRNFCTKCGFKVDPDFKYCPNCGEEVVAKYQSQNNFVDEPKTQKILACQNCGEDNYAGSVSCSSCGVKLIGTTVEKGSNKPENFQNKKNKSKRDKKVLKEKDIGIREKTLDSKKILLLSSFVIVLLIVLLASGGVFNSEIIQNGQMTGDETGKGVDLSNVNTINKLENELKLNPNDKASIIKLANLLQDSGLYDRGIIYYKKYLELDPTDANARVDMGICYYNINNFETAISEMETALQYKPKHQLAHLNLGIVNLTAGNLDVSKDWFRKALEIDPNSPAGKRAQELLQSH